MFRTDSLRPSLSKVLPLAALALLVSGSGYAQDEVQALNSGGTLTQAGQSDFGPGFEPSSQAAFEEAFAPFAQPVEPQLQAHAVDITTIVPPQPASTSLGRGVASYYGRRFHGRLTANGERFDMHAMTAAHKTLPFGTRLRVTNVRNGRSVIVRINDRGPFIRGRTIDLSRGAAEQIGLISSGHGTVELERLDS